MSTVNTFLCFLTCNVLICFFVSDMSFCFPTSKCPAVSLMVCSLAFLFLKYPLLSRFWCVFSFLASELSFWFPCRRKLLLSHFLNLFFLSKSCCVIWLSHFRCVLLLSHFEVSCCLTYGLFFSFLIPEISFTFSLLMCLFLSSFRTFLLISLPT